MMRAVRPVHEKVGEEILEVAPVGNLITKWVDGFVSIDFLEEVDPP